jgi:O-acetylhomoserine/O-acetylserine sulfhydrylase-like pyridoxal-dependent enzyme
VYLKGVLINKKQLNQTINYEYSKFATNALHAGHDVTKTAGTRAVPIYQTSSYVFNNSEHASNLFSFLNQDLFIPV